MVQRWTRTSSPPASIIFYLQAQLEQGLGSFSRQCFRRNGIRRNYIVFPEMAFGEMTGLSKKGRGQTERWIDYTISRSVVHEIEKKIETDKLTIFNLSWMILLLVFKTNKSSILKKHSAIIIKVRCHMIDEMKRQKVGKIQETRWCKYVMQVRLTFINCTYVPSRNLARSTSRSRFPI